MADYDGGVLAVGINVDIQRTDGEYIKSSVRNCAHKYFVHIGYSKQF